MGTRILTVEDDERIRTAVKLALEDEGWTVDEAGSGEEAIELFQRATPDVVLIDIMLPGIDGFELCRTLRRSSDVPIVMVTARDDTHDVVADVTFRGERHDLLIANTQYSCISALDPVHSFRPVWQPRFISALVPEDRCHLNGVCAEDGGLAYATICGQFDERLAWKQAPTGQGFVMSFQAGGPHAQDRGLEATALAWAEMARVLGVET